MLDSHKPMKDGESVKDFLDRIDNTMSKAKCILESNKNSIMGRRILKTRHLKLCPIIGFGYWKDVYLKESVGMEGVTHNFIFPFVRIQWGFLVAETA